MKTDTKQIIEIVGIFGVIASLLFVGMQVMLERRVATAGQYQNRAEIRMQQEISLFENKDWIEAQARDWEKNKPRFWNEEVESLHESRQEPMSVLVTRVRAMVMFVVLMQNNYYQYEQGFLEEDVWSDMRQTLKNSLRDPIRRGLYSDRGDDSFRALIQELLSEIDAETFQ
jgi:hypothetical protein